MHERLEYIKQKYFIEEHLTCVVANPRGDIYPSKNRGVLPLLRMVNAGLDFEGGWAADKVVGKGAAMLYALLNISELWADVISKPAFEVLQANGITCFYGELADEIVNRAGDGRCPMEEAVLEIDDVHEAYEVLKARQKELLGKMRAYMAEDKVMGPSFVEWDRYALASGDIMIQARNA